MSRFPAGALFLAAPLSLLAAGAALAEPRYYPLDSTAGLRLHHVTAEPATLLGKKGVRITMADESRRRFEEMRKAQQQGPAAPQRPSIELLAAIEGLAFANGTIEAEIAGEPAPGAGEGARGFVGLAFRVQNDLRTYDAFYLRPTNGRAEDQARRNHAAQYISHPDWPWFRLREETPSKYEAYVDLVAGVWTRIRIEVQGERARLYVHDQEQPTLIVNDLKTGTQGSGGVALWLDVSTVAHFRGLTVTPAMRSGAP
jgi:hypothetical protein